MDPIFDGRDDMTTKNPSLIEILYPHRFPSHPKREEATRTILQPEIDRFEQAESLAAAAYRIDGAMAQTRAAPSCGVGGAA